jgi:hypothetical protein
MDEYPITTEFQVLSSGSLNPTITADMGNQWPNKSSRHLIENSSY